MSVCKMIIVIRESRCRLSTQSKTYCHTLWEIVLFQKTMWRLQFARQHLWEKFFFQPWIRKQEHCSPCLTNSDNMSEYNKIKTCVSLQAWLFFPFCFSRGITLQAHRVTASLSSPRTVFPTSMSVSSMLNKSNLKTELPCDFGFQKKTMINKNKNNSNNSASSITYSRRRGNRCSPLQHIRGVPASVALKVPIYKVIGLRVFNSGREADLKPPLLPSTWTAAD